MAATPPSGAFMVRLSNWAVTPDATSLLARTVQFWAVNDGAPASGSDIGGGTTHELIVAAEDSPGSDTFTKVVVKLTDIKPGQRKLASVPRPPGTYELSCRVTQKVDGQALSHYAMGMHTLITVV